MNHQPSIARESLAIILAVAIMSLKVFIMLSLLRRWKVRDEPDI
jgi:hypothetical protein